MDDVTRRRLRKYGMAALHPSRGPDGSVWPPPGDVPEVGVSGAEAEPEPSPECRVCGQPVEGVACEQCGAGTAPSLAAFLIAVLSIRSILVSTVAFGLLAGIYQYIVSPAADLPLLASVVIGPLVLVAFAWLIYRAWYRRRYGKE